VGVEHQGGYYDHAGALRDMVQNHLLQILCLVAMEPPVSFQSDEIPSKKVDVLRTLRPFPRSKCTRSPCVVSMMLAGSKVSMRLPIVLSPT